MIVDESIGYWSYDTSHYHFQHLNDDGISEDESLEVSASYGRCEYRLIDNIHYNSCNCGAYHSSDDRRGGSLYK